MFLTNLDTVVIALFLGSGVILITLLGILMLFRFKYKETRILLTFFFRLAEISLISIIIYTLTFLFRWPNLTDILIYAILNIFALWFYSRLFTVFRQFINPTFVWSCMVLTIINFLVLTIQIITDSNSLLLLFAFLSLILVTILHFLILSVLIEFQGEPIYDK
jgi:hypothetical protein